VHVLGEFCGEFLGRRCGTPIFMVHHNPTICTKASTIKAQKGPSTHIIGDAGFIKSAINSKKAEALSFFLAIKC
jgi:hypothetical protein